MSTERSPPHLSADHVRRRTRFSSWCRGLDPAPGLCCPGWRPSTGGVFGDTVASCRGGEEDGGTTSPRCRSTTQQLRRTPSARDSNNIYIYIIYLFIYIV